MYKKEWFNAYNQRNLNITFVYILSTLVYQLDTVRVMAIYAHVWSGNECNKTNAALAKIDAEFMVA